MIVKQALAQVKKQLKDRGIDTYSIDASLLVMRCMGFSKMQLVTHDADEVDAAAQEKLRNLVRQRLNFKPMQYILGKCEFMGLDFVVNRHTLIPRPDTELLVESAIAAVNKFGCKTALDIGTGSGAIAVSLAKYCNVSVTASDISQEALDTAGINAKNNDVSIKLVKSNMFDNVYGSYDIIVSNPPYIETSVIDTLDRQVKDFEPRTALDGGKDGLDFYRIIVRDAGSHMTDCCRGLFLEIGYNQAEMIKKLLSANNYRDIEIKKDLAGLDRLAIGYKMC